MTFVRLIGFWAVQNEPIKRQNGYNVRMYSLTDTPNPILIPLFRSARSFFFDLGQRFRFFRGSDTLLWTHIEQRAALLFYRICLLATK